MIEVRPAVDPVAGAINAVLDGKVPQSLVEVVNPDYVEVGFFTPQESAIIRIKGEADAFIDRGFCGDYDGLLVPTVLVNTLVESDLLTDVTADANKILKGRITETARLFKVNNEFEGTRNEVLIDTTERADRSMIQVFRDGFAWL